MVLFVILTYPRVKVQTAERSIEYRIRIYERYRRKKDEKTDSIPFGGSTYL